jgi:hypothetical protein
MREAIGLIVRSASEGFFLLLLYYGTTKARLLCLDQIGLSKDADILSSAYRDSPGRYQRLRDVHASPTFPFVHSFQRTRDADPIFSLRLIGGY